MFHTSMLRGQSLGSTHQLPNPDAQFSTSREKLFAQMCVCMGGRVAEEMIYGKDKVTTGAQVSIICI